MIATIVVLINLFYPGNRILLRVYGTSGVKPGGLEYIPYRV